MILAVDTTSEFGSIALARGEEILEEVAIHAPTGFAQVLYRHLTELLTRNSVALLDIDCFAAAAGPGSFTGVRVGLACIKGLAEAMQKPAAAVSNLRALASYGTAPLRATLIDARRGEIYGAVYAAEGHLIMPETVTKLDRWLAELPPGVEFIAHDFSAIEVAGPRVTAPRAMAAAIARITGTTDFQDPAALDANYVRRPDIRE